MRYYIAKLYNRERGVIRSMKFATYERAHEWAKKNGWEVWNILGYVWERRGKA